MRTEKINNRINFNGYKLQTFKTPLKKIEIYSLNSQDKPFIERMLNVVGGHKFTEDKHLIGGENTKEVFRSALKKAKNLSGYGSPKVMLAIENNKKITGIMSTDLEGDLAISHLAVWNKDLHTRLSFIMSGIKEALRYSYTALCIPSKNYAASGKTFYRKYGFKMPSDSYFKEYCIDPDNLESALYKHLRSNIEVKFHKPAKNIDLAEKLKLDE